MKHNPDLKVQNKERKHRLKRESVCLKTCGRQYLCIAEARGRTVSLVWNEAELDFQSVKLETAFQINLNIRVV